MLALLDIKINNPLIRNPTPILTTLYIFIIYLRSFWYLYMRRKLWIRIWFHFTSPIDCRYNNNEKKNNKPFIAHIKILLLFIVTAQRMHKKQTLSLIASISASHGCNIKKKYKNIESVRKKTLNVTPATAVEQVALWLGLIIYYNSRKKNSSTRDLSE